eukprot:evm.model.NODE_4438_length_26530_cov_22.454391.9
MLAALSLCHAFLPPISALRPRLTRCESSLQNRRSSSPSSSSKAAAGGNPVPTPRVRFEGFDEAYGPAIGDTLSVIYNPAGQGEDAPLSLLEEDEAASPCLLYNFNGWDGEETPLRTPMFPRGDGTMVATVHIPNYAKVLDCIVSDGQLAFDTEGGAYFHLRIAHVQEEKDGTVYNFLQGDDGSLTLTGVEAANDARELERMIEDELSARNAGAGGPGLMLGEEEEVEGTGVDVANVVAFLEGELEQAQDESSISGDIEELLLETEDAGGEAARQLASTGSIGVHVAALKDVGNVPQQLRAEAIAVGEQLGISSSMIINELREAFDSVTDAELLTFAELPQALSRMGFDGLSTEELEELCLTVQKLEAPKEGGRLLSLEHFMRIFFILDEDNVGITIV